MGYVDLDIFLNIRNGVPAVNGNPAIPPMDSAKLAQIEQLIQQSPLLKSALDDYAAAAVSVNGKIAEFKPFQVSDAGVGQFSSATMRAMSA
jgi:hypothetical protein